MEWILTFFWGAGEYQNARNVANSHDLISAIIGRILHDKIHTPETIQKDAVLGDHMDSLVKDPSYEGLCTYTRKVIQRLVFLDTGMQTANMDIRFVRDYGTISRSQNAPLYFGAKEHCRSMVILYGLEDDKALKRRMDERCKDYRDWVDLNVDLLKTFPEKK